jgi:hypothetical protein
MHHFPFVYHTSGLTARWNMAIQTPHKIRLGHTVHTVHTENGLNYFRKFFVMHPQNLKQSTNEIINIFKIGMVGMDSMTSPVTARLPAAHTFS